VTTDIDGDRLPGAAASSISARAIACGVQIAQPQR
jgi:hypothetical protein